MSVKNGNKFTTGINKELLEHRENEAFHEGVFFGIKIADTFKKISVIGKKSELDNLLKLCKPLIKDAAESDLELWYRSNSNLKNIDCAVLVSTKFYLDKSTRRKLIKYLNELSSIIQNKYQNKIDFILVPSSENHLNIELLKVDFPTHIS